MSILRIGIECENLEDPKSRWGIRQITLNLLEQYVTNPEWRDQFKFYLYFKKGIPDDEVLKNLIFVKRVLGFPSFNIFYHILMPLRAMADRLDCMFFPAYMLPPLYFGKSLVLLTDDVYYEYRYGNLPFRYKLAYRLFTNWAAIKATKIMAISKTSKKEIARLYRINPDKIFVNYLGVKPRGFTAAGPSDSGFRGAESSLQKNSLHSSTDLHPRLSGAVVNFVRNPKSETVSDFENSNLDIVSNVGICASNFILYVGQMFPRRHAKETILAFEKLLQQSSGQADIGYSNILKNIRISELKLVMIGPDKYLEPTIKSLVKQINLKFGRDTIIHKDYVEDSELVKLYANAKALVYVSDREAFGLPPLEALSFGAPPIIMDNELGHELFGDYAFYSKSGNVDDITNAIKQALIKSQKIDKIKSEGPEFVKKYNWKNFADNFFGIISK